jgi:ubiquinone/menaquinone biosynthesis C-methylase UbiE
VRGVYDDERLAAVYQAGNDMPESSVRDWTQLFGSYVRHTSPPAVIDIGAGTGMFSAAMARWLEASVVIGVDPSIPMLMQARRCHPCPGVHYVAGDAQAVPVRGGCSISLCSHGSFITWLTVASALWNYGASCGPTGWW